MTLPYISNPNLIQQIRISKFKLDQTQFGKLIGLSQPTVSRMENGGQDVRASHIDGLLSAARKKKINLKPADFFQTKR